MSKVIHTENAPAAIGTYSQARSTENLTFKSGQIPDASAFENPGSPCETPHFTKPAFFVLSKVLDFFEPEPPPPWPQATSNDEASTTKIQVLIFNNSSIVVYI